MNLFSFIHHTQFEDLPESVVRQGERCLLDLIGVAAAGTLTELSRIICDHAAGHFGSSHKGARMLFDGRRVSPIGAVLAGGMTIDSLDAHDGHVLTKGHVGVAILPALLAYADSEKSISSREFLTCLVIGYEVATRAGIALHATACDYHTSGAWNSLACAALGARLLDLSQVQTREALGIAEYHGPRSQMMRCIDYPTMVKDGSGWGAMAGVSAVYLAASGFTGAPALTVEAPEATGFWSDLGVRWRILEQYFKPYPVCRWAQPAVEAALTLQHAHNVNAGDIDHVEVNSFHQAIRLVTRQPSSTEAAQYSLSFAVATALVRGYLGAEEVTGEALNDQETLRLSTGMVLAETAEYNARFPAERWAHVMFILKNGQVLMAEPAIARGNPENPLDDAELRDKYRLLTHESLGEQRSVYLQECVGQLANEATPTERFFDALFAPIGADRNQSSGPW